MFIPIVLCLLSYTIFSGLSDGKNMWRWIVVYWLVVYMKNVFDAVGVS